MDDDATSFADHKLCGFLYAVLSVTSPDQPNLRETLLFGTRFRISGGSDDVNFRSQNDVVLCPIDEKPHADALDSKQCEGSVGELGKRKGSEREIEASKKMRTRKRSIGLVNGSISVVHQLHALVMRKCLKIDALLVRVEAGVSGQVRAVLLIDVYLPIELWSGWQFPNSRSIAGALFRHLRCPVVL